jgi:aldehyde:ferredoxin oxidoreductase
MLVTEGKIARVDLTRARVSYEPSENYKHLIGGRALGSSFVFHEVPENTHPLGPENVLVFSTSPLTGTLAPSSGRFNISCKNVATRGMCFANAGGHFAPEMRYAGIDHVIVSGKSSFPVYLFLHDGVVEIKPADGIWGLDTWDTEDAIRSELGDGAVRVASIGQAGENLVTMACIMVDRARAAGWGGCGAVMGSKNLKALAARGKGSLEVDRPDDFVALCRKILARMDGSKIIRLFRKYGLLGTSGAEGLDGSTPQSVRNMEDEVWDPRKTLKMKETVFKEKYETLRLADFCCPVNCSHFYHVQEGPFAGLKLEALKTNVYRAFGTNLDVESREYVLKMNEMANRFGMNCDSLSAAVAWAVDVFEKGLIGPVETGGEILRWGDAPGFVSIMEKIAFRGNLLGNLLADGVCRAAKNVGRGTERYAMHAKGAGMCEQGVRSFKGWALGIMTSTRGGGHLAGAPNTEQRKMSREEGALFFDVSSAGEPAAYEGKGKLVAWFEKYKVIADTLGLCTSTTYWLDTALLGPDDFAELLNTATGWNWSGEDLMQLGERTYNLEKGFNTLHADFSRADDMPPYKLVHIPVSDGPFKGERLDLPKWNSMLDEYYQAHGWDLETGRQTDECLSTLQLHDLKRKLQKASRLIGGNTGHAS